MILKHVLQKTEDLLRLVNNEEADSTDSEGEAEESDGEVDVRIILFLSENHPIL